MKITIEHYDKKYSMEMMDETTLDELLRDIGNLLRLVGYCFNGDLDIVETDEQKDVMLDN